MAARSFVVLLFAAGLACHAERPADHAASHAQAPAPAEAPAHAHEHPAAVPAALTLDAGRKWTADASTTAAVIRMKQLADAAPAADAQDLPALRALGQGLRTELDGLISGCTMTGDAHAQLHRFLEPLMENIGTLQSGDLDAARAAQAAARARLAEYATYFE